MTNDQALQEAQTRANSFKLNAGKTNDCGYDWEMELDNAQSIATIAIETEIKTVDSLIKSSTYDFTISSKIAELKLIKEQIPNTL